MSKLKFVVLVIEDVHWASSIDLRLLVTCCRSDADIMVVMNSRPIEDEDLRFRDFNELKDAVTEAGVAKEAGLARPGLYRSLSEGSRPEWSTIVKVLGALGFTLQPVPISKAS